MNNTEIQYSISEVSENSLLIKYDETFSTSLSIYIARCARAVLTHFGENILNSIPSYDALLITFKPYITGDFLPEIREVIAKVPALGDSLKKLSDKLMPFKAVVGIALLVIGFIGIF